MENNTILALVKECLGIVATATAKDNEIQMLIDASIYDMENVKGIAVDETNSLHQTAIVQYVKGHFGMIDDKVKEMCMKSYNLLVSSLQLHDETED